MFQESIRSTQWEIQHQKQHVKHPGLNTDSLQPWLQVLVKVIFSSPTLQQCLPWWVLGSHFLANIIPVGLLQKVFTKFFKITLPASSIHVGRGNGSVPCSFINLTADIWITLNWKLGLSLNYKRKIMYIRINSLFVTLSQRQLQNGSQNLVTY